MPSPFGFLPLRWYTDAKELVIPIEVLTFLLYDISCATELVRFVTAWLSLCVTLTFTCVLLNLLCSFGFCYTRKFLG